MQNERSSSGLASGSNLPMTTQNAEIRVQKGFNWPQCRTQMERSILQWAIFEHQGNINLAAASIGLNRTTMYERCRALGLVSTVEGARKGQIKPLPISELRRYQLEPYDCGSGL